jgi:elongator complex protein 1
MAKVLTLKPLHLIQDPKEYLPFLRELRALDKDTQRFRIDDYLERWERALGHLHAGGEWIDC